MPEDIKALARRAVEEVWGEYNADSADKYFAADYVDHSAMPGTPPGLEGLKLGVNMIGGAFSETNLIVEDQIVEGDKVVTRWSWTGKHTGDLMGIPATGKQVMNTGIRIDRFEGGKAVEGWNESNVFGLIQQLGVIPMPVG